MLCHVLAGMVLIVSLNGDYMGVLFEFIYFCGLLWISVNMLDKYDGYRLVIVSISFLLSVTLGAVCIKLFSNKKNKEIMVITAIMMSLYIIKLYFEYN